MKNKLLRVTMFTILFVIICIYCFKPVLNNINFGIDLQGGFEVLYKVEPLTTDEKLSQDDLDKTYKAIINRIDSLGVSEPVINFEGSNLLRIQLPGASNEEEARERMSTTAVLSFRDVDDNLLMTSNVLGRKGASLDKDPETIKPVVKLEIGNKEMFYDVTKSVSEKTNNENIMIIWLDFEEGKDSYESVKDTCGEDGNMKCISAPYVNQGFMESSVIIQGNFTTEEAQNLVDLINAGSLPTKLIEESTPKSVSASFGNETINKAAISGVIAISIIFLILSFKYKVSGILSGISLLFYTFLVFLLFNLIGGVLTLTGIAALILGIGMAVDSSIISLERVKDEVSKGASLKEAVKNGNKRSLVSIIDSNITTLFAAIILYALGESSVKGFATALIITIVVTAISMIFINRFLINKFVFTGYFDKKITLFLGKIKEAKKYDFIKGSKYFIIVSVSIIAIGIIFAFTNKINFGTDFIGGTNISLSSESEINWNSVNEIFSSYEIVGSQNYLNTKKEGYIKLKDNLNKEEQLSVKEALKNLEIESSLNEISTLVTKNLTKNAISSLLYAMIAIIIYMAIRFSLNFGISVILMLIHDVVIVLAFFVMLKLEFNFILIAALLTIIGYSINDTIVVFDRIRENKKVLYNDKINKKEELRNLVNISSNETMSRNIWTSITTIIAVIILLIMGVNEIFTFNIAILIGLIAGSASSLVIASRVWYNLELYKLKHPREKKKNNDEIEEKLVKGINS